MAKQTKAQETIDVLEVTTTQLQFCIVGTSPLICNRMSEKAKRELLMPKGRKSAAEKAASLKHNPLEEFRASPYTVRNDDAPTLIVLPGSAFKAAMASAALDLPGANKSQIGRLTYVTEYNVPVYGVPEMLMAVTRSADMNRTPDVRTRAIIPHWACEVTVQFVTPLLRDKPVVSLMAAAGITRGIGDWRPEKGKGSFGQFRIASADDPEFAEIVRTGGRAAQIEAMQNPRCYDDETEDLLSWFTEEAGQRGFKVVA